MPALTMISIMATAGHNLGASWELGVDSWFFIRGLRPEVKKQHK